MTSLPPGLVSHPTGLGESRGWDDDEIAVYLDALVSG